MRRKELLIPESTWHLQIISPWRVPTYGVAYPQVSAAQRACSRSEGIRAAYGSGATDSYPLFAGRAAEGAGAAMIHGSHGLYGPHIGRGLNSCAALAHPLNVFHHFCWLRYVLIVGNALAAAWRVL